MKKIVPFTKDLKFKTKIGEITSISLDHTLKLNNQLVSGEFIISGIYKMLEDGKLEEVFDFKIPVDIAIDNKYDTKNCSISIDDFTYEIINDESLRVNISVMLDDLDIKEEKEIIKVEDDNLDNKINNDINIDYVEPELFSNLKDENEYSIYRVYTVKEDDTIDLILEKFNVTKDILAEYNDLDNLKIGSKIIIPSIDE